MLSNVIMGILVVVFLGVGTAFLVLYLLKDSSPVIVPTGSTSPVHPVIADTKTLEIDGAVNLGVMSCYQAATHTGLAVEENTGSIPDYDTGKAYMFSTNANDDVFQVGTDPIDALGEGQDYATLSVIASRIPSPDATKHFLCVNATADHTTITKANNKTFVWDNNTWNETANNDDMRVVFAFNFYSNQYYRFGITSARALVVSGFTGTQWVHVASLGTIGGSDPYNVRAAFDVDNNIYYARGLKSPIWKYIAATPTTWGSQEFLTHPFDTPIDAIFLNTEDPGDIVISMKDSTQRYHASMKFGDVENTLEVRQLVATSIADFPTSWLGVTNTLDFSTWFNPAAVNRGEILFATENTDFVFGHLNDEVYTLASTSMIDTLRFTPSVGLLPSGKMGFFGTNEGKLTMYVHE